MLAAEDLRIALKKHSEVHKARNGRAGVLNIHAHDDMHNVQQSAGPFCAVFRLIKNMGGGCLLMRPRRLALSLEPASLEHSVYKPQHLQAHFN